MFQWAYEKAWENWAEEEYEDKSQVIKVSPVVYVYDGCAPHLLDTILP